MSKRRLPPLNSIRAFEASARNLSFANAAKELHVTHSAISQQVKQLEAWLDTHLFIRLNNGLVLTDKGKTYLPELKQALDIINEATERLHGEQVGVTLTLSVLPNFAMRWLIPKLHHFYAKYPWINLRILSATLPLEQLYETCDLAIRPYEHITQYKFDWLCSAQMLPVMSPAFIKAHGIKAPRDLLRAPRLHITHSPEDWRRWFTAQGLSDELPQKGLVFDSHAVAIEAATQGLGAIMGQTPFIGDMINAGVLVAPFSATVDTDRSWYLVSPRSVLSSKAEIFRDWLLSMIPDPEVGSGAGVEETN